MQTLLKKLHYSLAVSSFLLLCFFSSATQATEREEQWSISFGPKRSSSSHTSFEFGNPDPPYQKPLSRLEFPMNVWWFGGEVRHSFSRFSLGAEIYTNIQDDSSGRFKDSDWTGDYYPPNVKDIYSEASNRVRRSYMGKLDADMKVSDWIGLSRRWDLRTVIGFRWQDLNFTAHDGLQTYPAFGGSISPIPYPGDAIDFNQKYRQYFFGVKTAYDIGSYVSIPRAALIGQIDWAYVEGKNADHHLLRGNRWTYEDTKGDAWHGMVGLKLGLAKDIDAVISYEYSRIKTTGSHRWVDPAYGLDMTCSNGVKVWSKQTSLMMNVSCKF